MPAPAWADAATVASAPARTTDLNGCMASPAYGVRTIGGATAAANWTLGQCETAIRSQWVAAQSTEQTMGDSVDDLESEPRSTLDYPFEAPPARGASLEVAPGVHWIRMPLP